MHTFACLWQMVGSESETRIETGQLPRPRPPSRENEKTDEDGGRGLLGFLPHSSRDHNDDVIASGPQRALRPNHDARRSQGAGEPWRTTALHAFWAGLSVSHSPGSHGGGPPRLSSSSPGRRSLRSGYDVPTCLGSPTEAYPAPVWRAWGLNGGAPLITVRRQY